MYPLAQAANTNGSSLDFCPVSLPALYPQRPLSWPPLLGFPGGSDDGAPARNVGDPGSVPRGIFLAQGSNPSLLVFCIGGRVLYH